MTTIIQCFTLFHITVRLLIVFYEITSETGDHVYVVKVLPAPLPMSDSGFQVIGHHAQVIIHIVHRVCPAMERAGYYHEVTVYTADLCQEMPISSPAPGVWNMAEWSPRMSGHEDLETDTTEDQSTEPPAPERLELGPPRLPP